MQIFTVMDTHNVILQSWNADESDDFDHYKVYWHDTAGSVSINGFYKEEFGNRKEALKAALHFISHVLD